MTKNEYDLIEDFILYYGYLFGYENIIIIDNNSTNQIVLDVYRKYIEKGIILYYEENYQNSSQGEIFTKYMLKYKSTCYYLIGLDTDEFLFSLEDFKNNNNPFDKDKILKVFEKYNNNDTLFSIDSYPCSIVDPTNLNYINNKILRPARNIIYFSEELPVSENMNEYWKNVTKQFSKSDAFLNTTCGNHVVYVSYGNTTNSLLGFLHFNSTGKRRYYERSMAIIEGYQYFSTTLDINTQINILVDQKKNFSFGHHKVNTYHYFLLRKFIVDLFVKYIKRLPTLTELEYHINKNINNKTDIIENDFSICDERISNINKNFIIYEDNEINNLIFYDEPINNISKKYNIFINSYLQKIFNEFL